MHPGSSEPALYKHSAVVSADLGALMTVLTVPVVPSDPRQQQTALTCGQAHATEIRVHLRHFLIGC